MQQCTVIVNLKKKVYSTEVILLLVFQIQVNAIFHYYVVLCKWKLYLLIGIGFPLIITCGPV